MKMTMNSKVIQVSAVASFVLCVAMVSVPSASFAQTKPAAKPAAKKTPSPSKPTVGSSAKAPAIKKGQKMAKPQAKKGGAIDLGEMRVEGKLVKPEVFYVLRRQKPQYKDLKLKRSFVRLIIRSARTNPF